MTVPSQIADADAVSNVDTATWRLDLPTMTCGAHRALAEAAVQAGRRLRTPGAKARAVRKALLGEHSDRYATGFAEDVKPGDRIGDPDEQASRERRLKSAPPIAPPPHRPADPGPIWLEVLRLLLVDYGPQFADLAARIAIETGTAKAYPVAAFRHFGRVRQPIMFAITDGTIRGHAPAEKILIRPGTVPAPCTDACDTATTQAALAALDLVARLWQACPADPTDDEDFAPLAEHQSALVETYGEESAALAVKTLVFWGLVKVGDDSGSAKATDGVVGSSIALTSAGRVWWLADQRLAGVELWASARPPVPEIVSPPTLESPRRRFLTLVGGIIVGLATIAGTIIALLQLLDGN